MTSIRIRCTSPTCTYEQVMLSSRDLAVWVLEWDRRHSHRGLKQVPFEITAELDLPEDSPLQVGESWIFKTRPSKNGNGNSVVASAPDGRAVLFDREAPLTEKLTSGVEVQATVKRIQPNYIIVHPTRIIGPVPPLDAGMPCRA